MWRVRKRGRRDISLLHPQSLLLTLLTTDYSPYNPLELEAELQLGDLIARDAGGVGGADARGRAPRDPRERGARHLEIGWGFVRVWALRARVSLASPLTALWYGFRRTRGLEFDPAGHRELARRSPRRCCRRSRHRRPHSRATTVGAAARGARAAGRSARAAAPARAQLARRPTAACTSARFLLGLRPAGCAEHRLTEYRRERVREGVRQRARSVDPRLLLGHALLPVDVVLDRGARLHTVAHGGLFNAGAPPLECRNLQRC